jgi:hypothetical protein
MYKLLVAAVALGSALAWNVAWAAPSGSACTPVSTSVRGHPGTIQCGPASAVVRFQGKTFRFRGGTCKIDGASFSLYVGTRVVGGRSNRLFFVELPRRAATRYAPLSAVIGVQVDYFSYQWQTGTLTLISGAGRGTFNGTLMAVRSKKPSGRFSGAFSCSGKL